MRAIMCNRFGPPGELSLDEVPIPDCGPGQVRIRVHAAGVNFPDTLIIEGKYQIRPEPPFSPGAEVAGTVDALGDGVTGLSVGDRVMALNAFGGFAEYFICEASRALPIPDSMDFVTAAGFTMTYGTSMHALAQRGRLQPGETLLVLGAGGGVGMTAVEIGAIMGARVIAAASSQEKLDAARAVGASETINYRTEDLRGRIKELTDGKGVDVVYDPVGGDLFEAALRSLAWRGRLLVVGFASGRIPQMAANLPLLKGGEVVGVFWGAFRQHEPDENRRNFERLFAWHAEGKLKAKVDRVMPLAEAPAALEALKDRSAVGKMVLMVND